MSDQKKLVAYDMVNNMTYIGEVVNNEGSELKAVQVFSTEPMLENPEARLREQYLANQRASDTKPSEREVRINLEYVIARYDLTQPTQKTEDKPQTEK